MTRKRHMKAAPAGKGLMVTPEGDFLVAPFGLPRPDDEFVANWATVQFTGRTVQLGLGQVIAGNERLERLWVFEMRLEDAKRAISSGNDGSGDFADRVLGFLRDVGLERAKLGTLKPDFQPREAARFSIVNVAGLAHSFYLAEGSFYRFSPIATHLRKQNEPLGGYSLIVPVCRVVMDTQLLGAIVAAIKEATE